MRTLLTIILLAFPLSVSADYRSDIDSLIHKMPRCAENLRDFHVKEHVWGNLGMAFPGFILFAEDIPRNELPHVVAHECGHIVDEALPRLHGLRNRMFGRPPFVSHYAQNNRVEDFAETYAYLVLNRSKALRDRRLRRKVAIVRSVLR